MALENCGLLVLLTRTSRSTQFPPTPLPVLVLERTTTISWNTAVVCGRKLELEEHLMKINVWLRLGSSRCVEIYLMNLMVLKMSP